jgi:UDP-2,3-diacylglucosamine hydrolase
LSDLILVADSHLRDEDRAADRFFRFLRTECLTAGTLILVGDIFDLWIARASLELPVHRALVETVGELRQRGVVVKYVQGNRDYFIADRYGDGPFVRVVDEVLVEEHGGRTLHVAHGDLVNLEDRQYLAWRRFSRSAFVRGAFSCIPPGAAGRLSHYLERRFRTTNTAYRLDFPRAHAENYAHRAFAAGADTVVLGHFHSARVLEFEKGRLFVLPGWREDQAYLRVDGSGEARFVEAAG